MYDWSDLRYFLAIYREGTLAGAGRVLRVDPTTVGRRIAALEDRLRSKLFVRGTKGWVATPAGRRIVPAAERVEDAALDVRRLAGGANEQPSGRVRIATIEMFASRVIAPALPALERAYPDIRIDLVCSPENVDLGQGKVDIAVRVGRPAGGNLVARRLQVAAARPYASRRYLEAKGLDAQSMTSLAGCDVLVLFLRHPWLDDAPDVRVALRSNEFSTVFEACRAGLGVSLLPDLVCRPYPDLVPLDGLGMDFENPIWLVMHRDLAHVARVRAVADFLIELSGQPA
ncbi:MAG: LysR family transcriptional regulator [Myxococcota bacterium]